MERKSRGARSLRGAILGFGNMAERGHLPGWLSEPGIAMQAVCDPSQERRQRAAELLPEARIYQAAEPLLKQEELDFVDICTPPPFHAAGIMKVLRAGVHALCEKPFVRTTRELTRIRRQCHQAGRIAFPVHNWKHSPILAETVVWLRQGLAGTVLYSEFHTLRTRPAIGLTAWRDRTEQAGGGILLDHGWHGIYILLNFHRERPIAVSAWMDEQAQPGVAEATVHLVLEFPSSTGSLFLTWRAAQRYNSARIYGDKGIAVLEDNRLILHLPGEKSARETAFPSPLSQGSHHPDWFGPVIRRFLSAMDHPEEAQRELEEAALCLEITRLGYLSMRRNGRRMQIAPLNRG